MCIVVVLAIDDAYETRRCPRWFSGVGGKLGRLIGLRCKVGSAPDLGRQI